VSTSLVEETQGPSPPETIEQEISTVASSQSPEVMNENADSRSSNILNSKGSGKGTGGATRGIQPAARGKGGKGKGKGKGKGGPPARGGVTSSPLLDQLRKNAEKSAHAQAATDAAKAAAGQDQAAIEAAAKGAAQEAGATEPEAAAIAAKVMDGLKPKTAGAPSRKPKARVLDFEDELRMRILNPKLKKASAKPPKDAKDAKDAQAEASVDVTVSDLAQKILSRSKVHDDQSDDELDWSASDSGSILGLGN